MKIRCYRQRRRFMLIRQEQSSNYDEVYELVKISFATSTNEGERDGISGCFPLSDLSQEKIVILYVTQETH
jgi:hypothetical protein